MEPIASSCAPAHSNPLIQNLDCGALAALAAYYERQVKCYPALDCAANGEDGIEAYDHAVRMWFRYGGPAHECGRRA